MKNILKFTLSICASLVIANAAFASDAHYGNARSATNLLTPSAHGSQVVLYNLTGGYYTAYTTFQPSGAVSSLTLGPYGSSIGTITYDINTPDTQACLDVYDAASQKVSFYGCMSTGSALISGYLANQKVILAH
jgi:hypothetical protein